MKTAFIYWLRINLLLWAGFFVFIPMVIPEMLFYVLIFIVASLVVGLPALVILLIVFNFLKRSGSDRFTITVQFHLSLIFISLAYGFVTGISVSVIGEPDFGFIFPVFSAILYAASAIAYVSYKSSVNQVIFQSYLNQIKSNNMDSYSHAAEPAPSATSTSNRILIKGIITAGLILAMLIPSFFLSDLVKERKQRQQEVTKEVSQKWAEAQTLSGPYIYLPYTVPGVNDKKEPVEISRHLLLLPENLEVNGKINHELRKRSIYEVLLYSSTVQEKGVFKFAFPKSIDSSRIIWSDARICLSLTDFKGIEEKIVVNFNGTDHELSPGLPVNDISAKGLSAPVNLNASVLSSILPFSSQIRIKGSERLHFLPLGGDSKFTLSSTWPAPSFDGNSLPGLRTVNDSGFTATWSYNKANLPFSTVLTDAGFDPASLAFGVTMVQPADGYSKTERSIKYAILIIGLSFGLFFIIELLQKKPLHPVQYLLIGLALVIFYSLLLSISEFIAFDYAYLVAAVSTILLVCIYAHGHFRSLKTAMLFGFVLTLLYGFTFVLIRLEDTALLIGSIGLFIILAIVMYFSRKINWYGNDEKLHAAVIAQA